MHKYLSLIKFSHTIFAMPFALIGFFLGMHHQNTSFHYRLFVLVILCMVFARSAAMAFNRYIDRKFDLVNPRTSTREIPAGIISPGSALIFVIINCALFITATWLINSICFLLSPVALLIVLGYSYTKRFTAMCHLVLGIGLSLAPIGAYLAVTGQFALLPLLFSLIVLFWVSGFDIIYALQDEAFDHSAGLNSIPSALGPVNALRLSSLFHLMTVLLLVYAGYMASFGITYWSGVIIFTALLVYQHSLVKPNNLSKVNLAFATTNGIASIVFSVFVLIEILT
jgi:4-hydroxybenzoate polyprenyltransferase